MVLITETANYANIANGLKVCQCPRVQTRKDEANLMVLDTELRRSADTELRRSVKTGLIMVHHNNAYLDTIIEIGGQ